MECVPTGQHSVGPVGVIGCGRTTRVVWRGCIGAVRAFSRKRSASNSSSSPSHTGDGRVHRTIRTYTTPAPPASRHDERLAGQPAIDPAGNYLPQIAGQEGQHNNAPGCKQLVQGATDRAADQHPDAGFGQLHGATHRRTLGKLLVGPNDAPNRGGHHQHPPGGVENRRQAAVPVRKRSLNGLFPLMSVHTLNLAKWGPNADKAGKTKEPVVFPCLLNIPGPPLGAVRVHKRIFSQIVDCTIASYWRSDPAAPAPSDPISSCAGTGSSCGHPAVGPWPGDCCCSP